MSYELIPCPCCGGTPQRFPGGLLDDEDDWPCVCCPVGLGGCGLNVERPTIAEAIEHWNRRATPATDRDAVLEEAAGVLGGMSGATRDDCIEAIRALKATPTPITPSAVADEAGQLRHLDELLTAEQRQRVLDRMIAGTDGEVSAHWIAEGRALERAAVVARTRVVAQMARALSRFGGSAGTAIALDGLADEFEKGLHIPPATERPQHKEPTK